MAGWVRNLEGIDRDIGALKSETGKMLAEVADRLAAESAKFRGIQKAVAERERELAELRARAAAFPKDLENAVNLAVKEISDKLRLEAKNREELARKEFEGERNVLAAKNESLERAAKDLNTANAKLAQQLESAYQKVQDIAEKTVDGTSQSKSLADLQRLLIEQSRKSREKA